MDKKVLKAFVDSYNSVSDKQIAFYDRAAHYGFYVKDITYMTVRKISKSSIPKEPDKFLTDVFNRLVEHAFWPSSITKYTTKQLQTYHETLVKELDARLREKGI